MIVSYKCFNCEETKLNTIKMFRCRKFVTTEANNDIIISSQHCVISYTFSSPPDFTKSIFGVIDKISTLNVGKNSRCQFQIFNYIEAVTLNALLLRPFL